MNTRMIWFKKNKDWLITLAVFLLFAIMLTIYGTFMRNGKKDEDIHIEPEAPLTYDVSEDTQQLAEENQQQSTPVGTTSFFLEPHPDELITKLENLNYQEFKEETRNLPGLRVMWPAYFFSVRKITGDTAEVLFDAAQNGFGVTLLATIDISNYPEVLNLQRGDKIWLAGEIRAVDPTGTGQFLLSTEYVRFDDYQPPARKNKEVKENQQK